MPITYEWRFSEEVEENEEDGKIVDRDWWLIERSSRHGVTDIGRVTQTVWGNEPLAAATWEVCSDGLADVPELRRPVSSLASGKRVLLRFARAIDRYQRAEHEVDLALRAMDRIARRAGPT